VYSSCEVSECIQDIASSLSICFFIAFFNLRSSSGSAPYLFLVFFYPKRFYLMMALIKFKQ